MSLSRFKAGCREGLSPRQADEGKLLCKGGGGQTNTVAKPWEGVQPYLTGEGDAPGLYPDAAKAYQKPLEYYPGQTYAGFTPEQQTGQHLALQYANQMPGMTQPMMAGNKFLASGAVLDPASNPYLARAAEAAIRPVEQSLTENVLPNITNQAVASGGLGGARQGVAQAQALRDYTQTAGDITSKLYASNYGQGLNAMTRGLALAPQTLSLGLKPSQIYSAVGGERQMMNQAGIDEAMSRWDFAQQEPWNRMNLYSNVLQPGMQFGSQSTSTDMSRNRLMGGLGGGLMAGAGLEMMGMASVANPMFWPVLAGGAALGAFG